MNFALEDGALKFEAYTFGDSTSVHRRIALRARNGAGAYSKQALLSIKEVLIREGGGCTHYHACP